MEQRQLGRTGLRVSHLGLGTLTWSRDTDEHEAREQLRDFVEAGGTLVDTSASYADGGAEELIGSLLGDVVAREDVVLCTKAGVRSAASGGGADASRGGLLSTLDASLRRLGTDHVDLWLVQVPDFHTPLSETVSALRLAVTSGRARYVGLSNHPGWQVARAATLLASDVGLAAVEPGTGAVRAIYGGKNYLKQPFSDATQASWQPGSSFKAFTLAAMLKENIGLRSTADGNTLTLPDGEQVRNEFHRNYGSSVNMLYATEQSINTAFVDVTQKIGPTKVVDAAIAAGVPKDPKNLQAVPVVTLGVASETPLTMANAYATMAAQGKRADAHTIDIVKTRAGKTRLKVDANVTQTIDVDVTRDVTYALEQVVQRGTGTAARALDRPVAGKTGTHEDLTAWFMGYTPQLSASVGFYKVDSKGKRLSLDGTGGMSTFFGGIVPTKMWTEFMKLALAGQPVEKFDGPADIGGRIVPTSTSTATSTPSPSVRSVTAVWLSTLLRTWKCCSPISRWARSRRR